MTTMTLENMHTHTVLVNEHHCSNYASSYYVPDLMHLFICVVLDYLKIAFIVYSEVGSEERQ